MDWSWTQNGEFSAAICGFIWAIAVILFKKTGERIEPVALNLFKGTVGLILFVISMLVLGLPFFPAEATASDWWVLLLSGALGIGIADSIMFEALNRLGAGRMAIVDASYSPLVILCSLIYLHEPVSPWLFLALGLMAGAILIGTWNPIKVEDPVERRRIHIGAWLGVLSIALMAIGIVMAKPVLDHSGTWWATTVRLAGGWGLLAVQGALPRYRAGVKVAFTPSAVWKVSIPASVFGTYLALIFWILGMKFSYTTVASVLNQLSIIFMLLFATLFLREPFTWRKGVAISLGFGAGILAAI